MTKIERNTQKRINFKQRSGFTIELLFCLDIEDKLILYDKLK